MIKRDVIVDSGRTVVVEPEFTVEHHMHQYVAIGSGFVCSFIYGDGVRCTMRAHWNAPMESWGARIYPTKDTGCPEETTRAS